MDTLSTAKRAGPIDECKIPEAMVDFKARRSALI
jgi:hypothetical protein